MPKTIFFQKGQFWPKMSFPGDVYDENIRKGHCNLLSKKRFIKPMNGRMEVFKDHLRRGITLEVSNDLFGKSSCICFDKKKVKAALAVKIKKKKQKSASNCLYLFR